jgi:tetratricopeptide (TPR) repeat protein
MGHLFLSPNDCFAVSQKMVSTALDIDSSLAEAHATLGFINTFHLWDFDAADKEFRRAIDLNPSNADLREFYALYLGLVGRYDEGFAQVRRGLELDPVSLILNAVLGLAYYWGRQYDEALHQLNQTMELDRNFIFAHLFRGFTLEAMERWDEAIAAFQIVVQVTSDAPIGYGHLGMVYGLAGQKEKAEGVLKQLDALAGHRYVPPLYRALVHAGLGQWDEAFADLDTACKQRDSWMPALYGAPFADPFRSDPRFKSVLKRIGIGSE